MHRHNHNYNVVGTLVGSGFGIGGPGIGPGSLAVQRHTRSVLGYFPVHATAFGTSLYPRQSPAFPLPSAGVA